MSISLFLAGEGWQMVFESIDQPSRSSEVERNPKKNEHFIFWLERGGGWGSSPLTSPADHQNQNVMLTWDFNFSIPGGRGTLARTKMPHWPESSTFPFLGGGYIGQNQNVTLTWDFNFSILGGGVHRPEPKCHIVLRFQLFHSWGGVHLQVDRKSVRFTDSSWLSTAAASRQLC